MLEQWIQDPSKVGATVLLLGAILALMKGWVVPGIHHQSVIQLYEKRIEKLTAERDQLLQVALKSTDVSDRALFVAQKQVEQR